MQGSSKTEPADEEVLDWTEDDDKMGQVEDETGQVEDKMDEGKGDEDAIGGDVENRLCDLFPWEHNEIVCRELLNCFDVKTVVHYNTNTSWPLACARHSRNFVGFARNEVHAQHIRQVLIAQVVAEIIEGKDGFAVARFLSRQTTRGLRLRHPPTMESES